MSGRLGIVAEQLAQPGPGPGEPGPHDHGGEPEHLGDLARLEALPQVQLEHLLVAGAEPAHRRGDVGALHDVVAGVGHGGRELPAQPVAERGAPVVAAPVVGEHPPGDAVQPRPGLGAARHVREPSPRDQERVRGDVGGVLRAVGAAQREAEDRVEVGRVQAAERLLAARRRGHVSPCPAVGQPERCRPDSRGSRRASTPRPRGAARSPRRPGARPPATWSTAAPVNVIGSATRRGELLPR